MTLFAGPTGKLSKGHVLDVGLEGFKRALTDLDKRLYIKWNPSKLRGWGCWEIRMRPSMKTSVYHGHGIYKLDYLENDMVHHVMDCAFLNYDAIRKLKAIDTSDKNHFVHRLERIEEEQQAELRLKAQEERKYAIKQSASAMRDFYEMVRSGIHPGRILTSTKWDQT